MRTLPILALGVALSCTGCIERHVVRYAMSYGCKEHQLKVVKDERGLYRIEGCKEAAHLACTSAWSSYACSVSSPYEQECADLARAGHELPRQAFPFDEKVSEESPQKEEIRRTVQSQTGERFAKCFDCALKAYPARAAEQVGGMIVTAFAVDVEGRVTSGTARSVSIAPELPYCVLGALANTQFPAQPIFVRYPVTFLPRP